jgi:hypothetical protein
MFENEKMIADAGGNFVLAPAGNHIGRLCYILDLGTADNEFTNEAGQKVVNHSRKMMAGFELIGSSHVFSEEKGPEPFVVHKEYTYKISKKSTLGKDLKSWLSEDVAWLKECKPEDVKNFNIISLLGKTEGGGVMAMINITHDKSEKGNERASIASITPVPKDMRANISPGKVKQYIFNFNAPFKADVFKSLPKFVQDKIRKSDEYKKLVSADPSVGTATATTAAPVQQTAGKIETPQGGDDLPF